MNEIGDSVFSVYLHLLRANATANVVPQRISFSVFTSSSELFLDTCRSKRVDAFEFQDDFNLTDSSGQKVPVTTLRKPEFKDFELKCATFEPYNQFGFLKKVRSTPVAEDGASAAPQRQRKSFQEYQQAVEEGEGVEPQRVKECETALFSLPKSLHAKYRMIVLDFDAD